MFSLVSLPSGAKDDPIIRDELSMELLRKSREKFEMEQYDSALYYINLADMSRGKVQQDPELAADIHEQYCLIYSALDDKLKSDYHRNMYLDQRERTRQDRNLEVRAERLEKAEFWLYVRMALLTIGTIVAIIAFFYLRRMFTTDKEGNKIHSRKQYVERHEELQERLAVLNHQLVTEKRQGAEKRAKVALLQNMYPFIARLKREIEHPSGANLGMLYLEEIEKYNKLLTEWIGLEQGKLALKLETFTLDEIGEILKKSVHAFAMQGITLNIELGNIQTKADRVLTLFMLNTLADNARKATAKGGTVTISAEEKADCIELSVTDNGKGMSEEVAANIFSHSITNGHGFGLLNCRGIINSYKKAGSLFRCCMIGVESELGKGTRFFFRLPYGPQASAARRMAKVSAECRVQSATAQPNSALCTLHSALVIASLMLLGGAAVSQAKPSRYKEEIADTMLRKAAAFADSAYYTNLEHKYSRTLEFADSVHHYLRKSADKGQLYDYVTIDISNEAAVAALGLHRWSDYRAYNNNYESAFYHTTNNDKLLKDCLEKEEHLDKVGYVSFVLNVITACAFALLIISLLRRYIHKRRMLSLLARLDIEGMEAEIQRLSFETEALHISNNILANGLSAIKHETMYYPSRIAAMIAQNDDATEMATFYEQMFKSLMQQMTSQKLSTGIHLVKMPNGTVADKILYDYLHFLIRKYDRQNIDPEDCFTPKRENIPLLIARQIMRDFSTSGSRGSGIIVDKNIFKIKF